MRIRLTSLLSWIWVGVLIFLMIEALLTPMIEWAWGFYNNKIIAVIGLCLITFIGQFWFNINKLEKDFAKLQDQVQEKKE
jgi:hypothetical protein